MVCADGGGEVGGEERGEKKKNQKIKSYRISRSKNLCYARTVPPQQIMPNKTFSIEIKCPIGTSFSLSV